jgi:hypothetical protein
MTKLERKNLLEKDSQYFISKVDFKIELTKLLVQPPAVEACLYYH